MAPAVQSFGTAVALGATPVGRMAHGRAPHERIRLVHLQHTAVSMPVSDSQPGNRQAAQRCSAALDPAPHLEPMVITDA